MKKIAIIFLVQCITLMSVNAQFLRTSGTKIVDDSNNEIILKGLNTNNWLLQEGYMMETGGAQWEIEDKIDGVVGEANRHIFYEAWLDNYFTKADFDSMASWGFNSVRAPFHYKWLTPLDTPGVFYEAGFNRIDSLLSWCEANQMWLILDMHAAPGGQGQNKEISDYNPAYPSLWESEDNKNKTIELWGEIARRYANEPWIGGYDLINEPNWQVSGQILDDLYERITDEIRLHDTSHIVFIEGNWFATDFGGLTVHDDNMAWSFHKYWNANNQGVIQYLLDLRNNTNCPLWLGETGENSNAWFAELVELCDQHDIGWAWWGTKKIESISSIFEVPRPSSYSTITNYWNNGGGQPSQSDAMQGLLDIADAGINQNNSFNMDMVYALVGYPNGEKSYPYAQHAVPGDIMATDFDMGHVGEAYYDVEYANFGTGVYNNGWAYRNSGIDIGTDSDPQANGYHVGWTEASEWMKYTVNVSTTGFYQVTTRVASNGEGRYVIGADSGTTPQISAPFTGGFNAYADVNSGRIYLEQGEQEIYFTVLEGGFDINKIRLEYHGLDHRHDAVLSEIQVNLMPNPTRDKLSIYGSVPNDHYHLRIVDVAGKEILQAQFYVTNEKLNYNVSLHQRHMEAGIYYVSIIGKYGVSETLRFYYLK